MKSRYLLPTVLIVIGLGFGFAGGYYYKGLNQQKQFNEMRNGAGQRGGIAIPSGGPARNINGFNSIDGEIISNDDKSVTVKLNDGSTKIIFFSESTVYSNFQEAKKEDLKTGIKISVFGKSNSDGCVTANRIQLNPIIKDE
ncbi:MAG TPA: hypothetical protein VI795_00825 [Patescibacteria group bacterium]|nr:hypothetical protein [Patescibacteria group bacterium]